MHRPQDLARRRDPNGAWELAERLPAPPLRGLVHRYVGFVETAATPLRRRETPTGVAVLVLNLGAPFRVGVPGPGLPARRGQRPRPATPLYRGGFVARISALPAVTEFVGTAAGIQVDLTPRGARMLLGVPMDAVPEPSFALEDLLGGEAALLTEELALLGDWESRLDRVDRFLLDRLAAAPQPPASLEWAWRELRASGGRTEIGALAERIGCSRRHLIAGFRDMVGVPPKTAAAIIRFERSARLLRDGEAPIAQVALECGYHDQSHMTRDFRRFAGATPAKYLRASGGDFLGTSEDEVKSVQDSVAAAV